MQYIHGRTEHRSNKLHIVQIHGNIQGRRVHMIDCLWKSHSVLLHWGETELTSLDHSHWWNWKARQLGGRGGERFLEQHSQQQATKIVIPSKFCRQAMSSSGEKSNKAAATPWALLALTLAQRGAYGISAFWFHQFITFTCVVCTCALKHNSGISFPQGSLYTIDCTM